jgi:uncharacterized protein YodC (DUF2158 family)
MLKLPKPAGMAIHVTLGGALSAPWAVPALADAPPNTATQSQTTPPLQAGELVRLRSGGPEMTVKSVQGNWVICTWWSQGWGGFQSAGFPIAMVAGPVTLPSDDAHPQTTGQKSPTEQSPTEPSVRRSDDSSSAGQTNQNSTAQGANQAIGVGEVRPANAGPSMSPGTRPARVIQLQQGNGINNQNWPVSPVQPQLSDPSARSPVGAGLRFGP